MDKVEEKLSYPRSKPFQKPDNQVTLVGIEEYRTILKDNESSDERIIKKLEYLEAFCRKIIVMEIEKSRKASI